MTTAKEIIQELEDTGSIDAALHAQRFFKTGKGEYGEGDVFLGLTAPMMKNIAKKYAKELPLGEVEKLLHNKYHEARSLALSVMIIQFEKGDKAKQKQIVDLYLKNVEYINNWDLVDISCHKILGPYVYENKRTDILYELAKSKHLWSERISVVTCYYLIKRKEFEDFKKIAESFFTHKHDLMHKAVGWMLREMGKADEAELYAFLDKNATKLPRTALRYSLERVPPDKKKKYMEAK